MDSKHHIPACLNPSVQKCLNCDRPYCNVSAHAKYDKSEADALIAAGFGRGATDLFDSESTGGDDK